MNFANTLIVEKDEFCRNMKSCGKGFPPSRTMNKAPFSLLQVSVWNLGT